MAEETINCKCPFYGFFLSLDDKIMINSKGNQCALKTQSYSPCIMQIDDQEIDWSKCVYNSDKDFEKVENGKEVSKLEIKVYPLEDGQTTLKGISFRDWAKMLGVEFKLFSPNI